MKVEKGVIMAVYKEKRGKKRFLALQRNKNWEGWELPKGHLEQDDYTYTVELELREETGIQDKDIQEVKDLNTNVEWSYEDPETDEEIKKEYKGFLVKVSDTATVTTDQNPCEEHENGFFMKKKDVKSLLTYDNQKHFLRKASDKLKQ